MFFYTLLLRLYPASFRDEYGDEMCRVFGRQLRHASGLGIAGVWLTAITDVVANATSLHVDILRQDVSYTARVLRRAPGFAATAVLIVALGIGATTAAFSVTDFVLLRSLPFPDAGRLVMMWETTPGYSRMELSAPNYRDWKAASRSFESLGVYYDMAVTMTGGGEPRRFARAALSADVLPTLRVTPAIGRSFATADDRPGAPGTAILSYRLWTTEFGGDVAVIGRRLTLDGEAYTVIGVMPATFHFPDSDVLLWTTTRFGERDYQDGERTNNYLYAVGRLRRGVSFERARAEIDRIGARSRRQYPVDNKDTGATLVPLGQDVAQRSRLLLVALFGAAACLLLVACANLANLLLARALGRRTELSLRAAIGAGRRRLVRQLMTESLVLAGAGGGLGIAFACAAVPLLARLVPATLPIASSPSVDLRVLLFAACVTLVTGIGFGLVPVLRVGRQADLPGLRGRTVGAGRERFRSVLVVAEIAASVVLLVSAGLLIRALATVRAIDPGFTTEGVLTLRTELPVPQYGAVAGREAFYGRVLDEIRALPGVKAAAYASFVPMSSFRGGIWPVEVKGDADAGAAVRSAANVACLRYVTPAFFDTLRIPLKAGRDISRGDRQDRPFVAVVSESFAKRYWPKQDPIGRHFAFAFADREVVGVAGDVRFRGLERRSEPQVYLSSQQVEDGSITFYTPKALAVRSSVAPAQLIPAVRAIIHRADPMVPITEVRTTGEIVDVETASRSTQVRLLASFAAMAFVLAAIGIYGLLSFSVAQRRQEIGVRVALGARPADVVGMIAGRSVCLALAGLVTGMAVAYAVGRGLEALLAGVSPTDAATLAAVVVLSVVMAIAGSVVPAIRAVGVDPVTALRSE